MSQTKRLWWTLSTVCILVTLVMCSGFVFAAQQVLFPPAGDASMPTKEQTKAEQGDSIGIVALGDSLTVGFGDSLGQGYVGRLRQRWGDVSDVPVYITANVARNGAKASEVLEALKTRPGLQDAVRIADVVVMTVGGNDLYTFGEDVDPSTFEQRIPAVRDTISNIFAAIRSLNNRVDVYYIGLYNPFVSLGDQPSIVRAVQRWNEAVQDVARTDARIVFVPTYDLFQRNTKSYLSSDNYHLNDDGYARVAERLFTLVRP
jgi:lysophospholipase L1-like esterase